MKMKSKAAIMLIVLIAIASIFSLALPRKSNDLPDDFIQVKRDMDKGILYGVCDLKEDYWNRPEFYPTWEKYRSQTHDFSRWGVTGFGAFPSLISYNVKDMKAGDRLETCTYVRSGWNIETFQGLHLNMDHDQSKFDVNIIPGDLLLSPTYPELIEGWTNKVKITIVAKEDIKGTYNFRLRGESPSPEKTKEYYNRVMNMKDYPFYECGWFDSKCNEDIVELRKKTYYNGGTFQADKFFDIEVIAH
ncbi:MAG: hypothetical protein OIN83_09025 [Candidatus Methanoperedens sp.]|nr:hypothetical protein [Candidatus Methanoperedens sp.]